MWAWRAEKHSFLGRELAQAKLYSENMAWLMAQEIRKLILEAELTAEQVLTNDRHVLDVLAEALVREETLERTEIEKIIKGAEKPSA